MTPQIHLLSKRDAIRLLELIHSSTACQNTDSLVNLMNKMGDFISFEYTCCEVARTNNEHIVEPTALINISLPEEYLKIYQKDKWRHIDPIQKDAIGHSGARFLAEIFKKNNPPKWMHAAAWDFKIKDGYAQAVWNKKNQRGSLFYFFGQSVKQDKRTEIILDLAVPHLHQALTRVFNLATYKRPPLSLKETEVVKWLKQGKTTWDISIILGISERTVKFHIGNLMKKLDVSTRTHAVAIAIEQGLVDIE